MTEKEIREFFAEGIARQCAESVWNQIDLLRSEKQSTRVVRQKLKKVRNVPQSEIAEAIDRTQGNVSRMLQMGTLNWPHLAIVMSHLDIEFGDLEQPLPPRDERALFGRQYAMYRQQSHTESSRNAELPSAEEIACLQAIDASNEWAEAEMSTSTQRKKKQDAAAFAVAEIADNQLGRPVKIRTGDALRSLKRKWGDVWASTVNAVPTKWIVE